LFVESTVKINSKISRGYLREINSKISRGYLREINQ